jgi:hypothetical protein
MATYDQRPDLETLAAVIARSPIVVRQVIVRQVLVQAAAHGRLPAGFEEVDIAILDWIAAEGRRVGRRFARM